jgi:hypothetical protein
MYGKLPDGSEEQAMNNLSLARIMYGTSQEFHSSDNFNTSASPAFSASSPAGGGNQTAAQPATLGELLHRAWMNLSGKS